MYQLPNSALVHDFILSLSDNYSKTYELIQDPRENDLVKRGLRNADGTGVMAGYTQIGNVTGYAMMDGERVPLEGRLTYRGYNILSLINGFTSDNRFGFEEIAYLLLLGELPNREQLKTFQDILFENMELPPNFTEDMILKHPSNDVMNKLSRSVLTLYSSDDDPDSLETANLLRQAFELIARFPPIVAYAYAVKRHYFDNDGLYLNRQQPGLSLAENFLHLIRGNAGFTEQEAKLLDLCLVLHAEHGGGNNSTFTCRVLSSTGTDTYSAIGAAIGSLKGPKHGGANRAVMRQFTEAQSLISDWNDDDAVRDYLRKVLRKEAGDGSGLIYGMGHAIYTLSDPRAVALKSAARSLAAETGFLDDLELMESIERLTPSVFAEVTGNSKVMCANVDMYSGLVYRMLGIPDELFTPLFAISRITGWCAHRIEEVITGGRIIRPAYKAIMPARPYHAIDDR